MSAFDETESARLAADVAAESVPGRRVVRSWRATTPVGAMSIELASKGVWSVTLRGFSRSSNRSLEIALAEATGARRSERWLQGLIADVEGTLRLVESD